MSTVTKACLVVAALVVSVGIPAYAVLHRDTPLWIPVLALVSFWICGYIVLLKDNEGATWEEAIAKAWSNLLNFGLLLGAGSASSEGAGSRRLTTCFHCGVSVDKMRSGPICPACHRSV